MPLLPHTRGRDDIAPLEDLVERCVAEVTAVVGSSCEHMAVLHTNTDRLRTLRNDFAQARQNQP